MTDSSADRDPVERLAEEFLERHRRGEHPPLTEYVDRHPERADEIRELFPALVMMERLKPAPGDVTGTFVGGSRPGQEGGVPERLADFRILREVGRGGMGIVYEAEQESLGRHVALKVLPSHALLGSRHLQRFLREARSAARLHHTNIVPVFSVGEHDGLHYYAMQFIAGSGLHEVVEELRRLKAAGRPTAGGADAVGPSAAGSLREIACGLLTGHYPAAPDGLDERGGRPGADRPELPATDVHARSAILSGSGRDLAHEVARLGLQVAEALAYAHGQGVLHRDIKPSNLLLDVQGTVWVADFGLAKAAADGQDLTHEGDLVGTLRYMAPERFRGQADARSDLYALGLTLYELLTLRPAFDQDDRDRLILQVTTEVPTRVRSINSSIPRDLETIVQKAIEHDPSRRYQDADELADDLERFLANRPIKARPVGTLERAGMWARRKPAIAGLLAGLGVALALGLGGIIWQWREAVAASHLARRNEDRARNNLSHALGAVHKFYTQVSEEDLLNVRGMQPLRRRLLRLALEYYQTFQREQARGPQEDDPKLLDHLALSYLRSGIINAELGDATAAHLLILRTKDILEELRRARPEDPTLKVQLVRCYIELEDVERLNNSTAQATEVGSWRRIHPAVELATSLVALEPRNAEYLRLLGRSYTLIGVRDSRRGLYPSARDFLGKAIAALEEAHRIAPDDGEAARWLALVQADLGFVAKQTGHPAERIRALRRALAGFERLERLAPRSRRARLDRGQALVLLGAAYLDVGRFRDAETLLGEADGLLARLREENPEAADARYWSAVVKAESGRLDLSRGRGSAGRSFGDAIAVYEPASVESRNSRDMLVLAESYLGLGESRLQAGHPEAVPPLRAPLAELRQAYNRQLHSGSDTYPERARVFAQVEGQAEFLLAFARATTPADRVAARQREVQARQAWADERPANLDLRAEAAGALVRLAELLALDGQQAEARAFLDRALPTLEELARAEPENLRWGHGLARALETLARVRSRSGQAAEARDAAGRAVAIVESLARTDPTYLYDLACMLGLRGSVSSAGADADAAAAVAALRRAIKAGFDNDHLLRTDPRLDRLRSRRDFPALGGSLNVSRSSSSRP